ncbi:MAG: hypothetical protein ABIG44_12600 [Planctomycetota bacterium]
MSMQPHAEENDEPRAEIPEIRKPASTWMVLGLLVLLAAWFVFTQIYARGGEEIKWHDDLAVAEQMARATGQRIFLVLHEPDCPITAGNDRDLFSQRYAKRRLAKMTCCRIELKPLDPLRVRFKLEKLPIMLVLEAEPGKPPISKLEGKVDQLQFETYVSPE